MRETARNKRRRRAGGVLLPGLIVVAVGGAIGAGLSQLDAPLDPASSSVRSGGSANLARGHAGHLAEPFVPCSSNVLDCFGKTRLGHGPGARRGAGSSGSRGPRSRLIPPRERAFADGFAGAAPPLDETLAIPLAALAEEVAPFTGGAGGSGARAAPQSNLFPASAGPGGIGGESAPVPTPTPTPTPTPGPEEPIPAVPEPAVWLQLLVGFAIVGAILRRRRTGRAAARFS